MQIEELCYHLSLFSYFDCDKSYNNVKEAIISILMNQEFYDTYKDEFGFKENLQQLKKIPLKEMEEVKFIYTFNDNLNSGIVFYIFSYHDDLIYAFRGSECSDLHCYSTGWQDWKDNLHMFFNRPTYQQIYAFQVFQRLFMNKKYYLCGHSKGGNIALYISLVMNDIQRDYLEKVIVFNAPGIHPSIIDAYQLRIVYDYIRKIELFENENDCISELFIRLNIPTYIRSSYPCNSIEDLVHNHFLYAMNDFKDNDYCIVERKNAVCKLVHYFVYDFFVNRKEITLKRLVNTFDYILDQNPTPQQFTSIFNKMVSKRNNLFSNWKKFD